MTKNFKTVFHNSLLAVMLSLVMAVSFFACPLSVNADYSDYYFGFLRFDTTFSDLGFTYSDFQYSRLNGSYDLYTKSSSSGSPVSLYGSSRYVYILRHKTTGDIYYSDASSYAGHVLVPFYYDNSEKIIESESASIKYSITSQTSSLNKSIDDQTTVLLDAINNSFDTQKIIDNANQNADDIMNSYDSSAGDLSADKLSQSLSQMDAAEGTAVSDAKVALDSYDFMDTLKFSVDLLSGLSFVYSMANSFFIASGNFSVIVTAAYCIAFLSIVLGLWRFFREK